MLLEAIEKTKIPHEPGTVRRNAPGVEKELTDLKEKIDKARGEIRLLEEEYAKE